MNYTRLTALLTQLGVLKKNNWCLKTLWLTESAGHQLFSLKVLNKMFFNKILNSAHANNNMQ